MHHEWHQHFFIIQVAKTIEAEKIPDLDKSEDSAGHRNCRMRVTFEGCFFPGPVVEVDKWCNRIVLKVVRDEIFL